MSFSGFSEDAAAGSPLTFPCDFPIKAIGVDDVIAGRDLRTHVMALVRAHAPEIGDADVFTRSSRAGGYRAVTVQVRATSRAQLDAIYRSLSADERIRVAL